MAITVSVADDLANGLLKYYTRGKALSQTTQDKPFLNWLRSGQQTFPGGTGYVSDPVQGAYMSDSATFIQGYSGGDALTNFEAANHLLRCEYAWKEVHMGFVVSWTELKQDGISIGDNQSVSEHSRAELVRLTKILENRLEDFSESSMRAMNLMCWKDGSQDAKQIVGLTGLIGPTADPAVGLTGALNRATYAWWRHRALVGANKVTASAANQTLTKALRAEARQLRRYGGRVNKILAGAGFIEALELEVHEKGVYTQEGFSMVGKTDIGMADIRMRGVGTVEYDPTLDDLEYTKFAYFLDGRRCKLRPMESEDMKTLTPPRPYDYMVFLKSLTWTGALQITQLNAQGVYEVA